MTPKVLICEDMLTRDLIRKIFESNTDEIIIKSLDFKTVAAMCKLCSIFDIDSAEEGVSILRSKLNMGNRPIYSIDFWYTLSDIWRDEEESGMVQRAKEELNSIREPISTLRALSGYQIHLLSSMGKFARNRELLPMWSGMQRFIYNNGDNDHPLSFLEYAVINSILDSYISREGSSMTLDKNIPIELLSEDLIVQIFEDNSNEEILELFTEDSINNMYVFWHEGTWAQPCSTIECIEFLRSVTNA